MTIQWPKDAKNNLRNEKNKQLFEAHRKVQDQAKANQKRSRPRTGVVRLSNTDSLRTAQAVKQRLLAKLAEVAGAMDVDKRTREAMVTDVKLQLDKVERKIIAIQRRQRAIQEEKIARMRRDNCPRARERRRHDMEKRTVTIRRDLLYSAQEGGFDPNNPLGLSFGAAAATTGAAVSFDVGGVEGVAMDAPAPSASVETVV